jgi:hydrogenase maturation factor
MNFVSFAKTIADASLVHHTILLYEGHSSQTGTFNFTGIKRDASVVVLHAVVSGKCVLLLIGGAHVAGQSRDR